MPYKNKSKQLQYQKKHYRDKQSQYVANQRLRRAKVKQWVDDIKSSNGCAACPENVACCLAFYHEDPGTKIQKINTIYKSKGLKFLIDENKKMHHLVS